jgi:hypothetical protein
MQKNVKRDGNERLSKVPADLDAKPYRDEHDFDLLRRLMPQSRRAICRRRRARLPCAMPSRR